MWVEFLADRRGKAATFEVLRGDITEETLVEAPTLKKNIKVIWKCWNKFNPSHWTH